MHLRLFDMFRLLFIGVISEAKGLYNLKSNYFNKDINFKGSIEINEEIDFVTYKGFGKDIELPFL